MGALNEPIARQTNAEDQCTGKFYKTLPGVLPFGPPLKSKAFKNVPDIFSGKAGLSLKPYWMKKP